MRPLHVHVTCRTCRTCHGHSAGFHVSTVVNGAAVTVGRGRRFETVISLPPAARPGGPAGPCGGSVFDFSRGLALVSVVAAPAPWFSRSPCTALANAGPGLHGGAGTPRHAHSPCGGRGDSAPDGRHRGPVCKGQAVRRALRQELPGRARVPGTLHCKPAGLRSETGPRRAVRETVAKPRPRASAGEGRLQAVSRLEWAPPGRASLAPFP